MKRVFLLIASVLTIGASASAQEMEPIRIKQPQKLQLATTPPREGEFRWGLSFGTSVNLNTASPAVSTPNIHIGWKGEFNLKRHWTIQTGLFLESSNHHYRYNHAGYKNEVTTSQLDLKLPIDIGYRIQGKRADVIPFVGLYGSYTLSGNYHCKMTSLSSPEPTSMTMQKQIKGGERFEWGARTGVTVDFRNGMQFTTGIQRNIKKNILNEKEAVSIFGTLSTNFISKHTLNGR